MSLLQVLVLFFTLTISDSCRVTLSSLSADNYTSGHITVNSENRLMFENRGIYTMILNRKTCATYNGRGYDTHAHTRASDHLATYVRGLHNGTTILGVSAGEVSRRLTKNAYDALAEIGVDMHGFGYMWKCNFVAVVGMPYWSVTRLRGDRFYHATRFNVTEREIIVFPSHCNVDLKSWGTYDPVRVGYIRVNNESRLTTEAAKHHRGIFTLMLNRYNCRTTDLRSFDTGSSWDASAQFEAYLRNLPVVTGGTVILGVSADDASGSFSQGALQALHSIGVNIEFLLGNGKLTFVGVAGHPEQSKYERKIWRQHNLVMNVLVTEGDVKVRIVGCFVELRSWGMDDEPDERHGHIKVNNRIVLQTSEHIIGTQRGIYTLILNRQNCRVSSLVRFDTYNNSEASENLAWYLRNMPNGTLILGVTAGTITSSQLTKAAYDAMSEVGVFGRGVGDRWKFAFIAVIGDPQSSKTKGAPNMYPPLLATFAITPTDVKDLWGRPFPVDGGR